MATFPRLIGLYRPLLGRIALSILISTIATVAGAALTAISGWFITVMAVAGATAVEVNYLTPAAIIRVTAIIRTAGRYAERVISHEATLGLVAETRTRLFSGLVPLSPGALDDLRSGEITARLKSDIDRIELVFLRLISPVAVATATIALAVAWIATLDARLAVAVAIPLIVGGILLPAGAAAADSATARSASAIFLNLRHALIDDLRALGPLIVVGGFPRRRRALLAEFDRLTAIEGRTAFRVALGKATAGLSGEAAMVAALAVGIPLVRGGGIESVDLTAAALLALAVADSTVGLAAGFGALPATLASAERIFALLDRPPTVDDPVDPAARPSRFDLQFDGVGLTYPGAERPALSRVDLNIPEGSRVAIVGPSGAGKTSLIELLARFRDPTRGEVRIGGVPLPRLRLDDARGLLAVARGGAHIFNDTAAANLRVARPEADDEEIARALASVGLEERARGPLAGDGGVRMSGGEGTRLIVARALLSDAPILVLDEPGEGLDSESEARLLDAVFERARGRTVLIVAHTPAALDRVDLVVAMDGGRIVGVRRAQLDAV